MGGSKEVEGTIEDVFGHRFTLKTDGGKVLVDLGPAADEADTIQPGARVAVKGEEKPSELKARSLRVDGGEWRELKGDADPEITDADVSNALKASGYGEGTGHVRKPKHVEVIAEKDGVKHKVHVHARGEIKKAEPVA